MGVNESAEDMEQRRQRAFVAKVQALVEKLDAECRRRLDVPYRAELQAVKEALK